ncbi:hypothetical protein B0J18DRAFT_5707 [Chaetomium sp. MPI-SDFR-AT-0129]|nr:hypothetical protein B0J18DRAFT_5707 [Chaetomium sp. MPI-SDFR-AT-0129]
MVTSVWALVSMSNLLTKTTMSFARDILCTYSGPIPGFVAAIRSRDTEWLIRCTVPVLKLRLRCMGPRFSGFGSFPAYKSGRSTANFGQAFEGMTRAVCPYLLGGESLQRSLRIIAYRFILHIHSVKRGKLEDVDKESRPDVGPTPQR